MCTPQFHASISFIQNACFLVFGQWYLLWIVVNRSNQQTNYKNHTHCKRPCLQFEDVRAFKQLRQWFDCLRKISKRSILLNNTHPNLDFLFDVFNWLYLLINMNSTSNWVFHNIIHRLYLFLDKNWSKDMNNSI